MVRFSMEVCELQHRSGRHFIFEQPQSSRAWSLNEVVQMAYRGGIAKTTFHQCMYGLEARDHQGSAPAYKPTSDLTPHCPRRGPAGKMQRWPSPRTFYLGNTNAGVHPTQQDYAAQWSKGSKSSRIDVRNSLTLGRRVRTLGCAVSTHT